MAGDGAHSPRVRLALNPVRSAPMVSFRRPRGDNRGRMKYTAAAVLFGLAACGEVNPVDGADGGTDVTVLIDDLEDGDAFIVPAGGRVGNWYTVNDGTGDQTPGLEFAPTLGGATDSAYCAATHGADFTEWGAKLGVYLNHPGADAPAGTFDASAYRGIRFYARGNVTVLATVNVMAARGMDIGGACDATLGGCNDYHGKQIALDPVWREYDIAFASLTQEGWGQAIAFEPATLVAIDFSVPRGPSFDFAIDNLIFYGDAE
jgi:hypothetical protein